MLACRRGETDVATLAVGEAFPELPNLGDLAGRLGRQAVVLFFYPKANTGG
jgi:peroxiredoxin